jgi:hypothetical protein
MAIEQGKVYRKKNGEKLRAEYRFEGIDFEKLTDKDISRLSRIGIFSKYEEFHKYNIMVFYRDVLVDSFNEKIEVDNLQSRMKDIHDGYLLTVSAEEKINLEEYRDSIRCRAIEEGHMPYSLFMPDPFDGLVRVETQKITERQVVRREKLGRC